MNLKLRGLIFFLLCMSFAFPVLCAPQPEPLRVVIVGLVHGHVEGLLSNSAHRFDIRIDGVSDPDRSLFDRYAAQFKFDSKLYHADVEEMLTAVKPQVALIYSNTFDHTKIVELCAKHHIPVMMEKPLATTVEAAHAIERAAQEGKIQVLVN